MPVFGRKVESGKGFLPIDKVRALSSNGVPEDELIEILRREGFSADEIDKTFTEVFKPTAPANVSPPTMKEVPAPPMPEERQEEEVEEVQPIEEKEASAPLFVKLDKYNQILTQLTEIKNALESIKNTFDVLSEVDKIEYESMRLIQNATNAVEKKLAILDNQFLKPSGFEESIPKETKELGDVLNNLKYQVDDLKNELKKIS